MHEKFFRPNAWRCTMYLIVAGTRTLLQSWSPTLRMGMHSRCFSHDAILISPLLHSRNSKWNLHWQQNQFSPLDCFSIQKDDYGDQNRLRHEVLSFMFGHQDERWGCPPTPCSLLRGLSAILSPAENSGLSSLQNAILQDSSKISSSGYILLFLIFTAISSHRIWSYFDRYCTK